MFNKLQERGQEMIQDEAENGEAWVAAGLWTTVVGATGTLILIGYLLWKLYRNQTHTKIKLCVELGSTSKTHSAGHEASRGPSKLPHQN